MATTEAGTVAALSVDPLYQLSTANQELFHTNMLYWLIRDSEEAAGPLMSDVFGILPPQFGVYRTTIRREYKHWDLYVDSGLGCGRLLLENKLHSLPRIEQLEQYYRDAPDKLRTVDTKYVLLSLIEPTFSMPEPWRYVDYTALLKPLKQSADFFRREGRRFDADLVANYAVLVQRLVAVRDEFAVERDPNAPVALDKRTREALKDARLLPLVEKLRASGLANLVSARVDPGTTLAVGLSNTSGLVQFSARSAEGHSFGWQYQGGQVRLYVVLDDAAGGPWKGRRSERERVVEQAYLDYFDFDKVLPGGRSLSAYQGRGLEWLGYEPDFVYKYRPIAKGLTYVELADVCARLTSHASQYAERR